MSRRTSLTLIGACLVTLSVIMSCTHKPAIAPSDTVANDGNFPPEIAKIIINRCAISGCHNQASYGASDSLLLDSWDHLFKGDINGSVIIPYRPEYSTLLYYVNTDSSLGVQFFPTMPENARAPLLSKSEYMTLYNWIADGAPDKNGNIPFASNAATRQKIYATTVDKGVDLMAVIDGKSHLIMRYIQIGVDNTQVESPHSVEVSDDGSNAYVCFYVGTVLQKINTNTDQVIGTVDLNAAHSSTGSTSHWSKLCLNHENTKILVSNWYTNGPVATVDTKTMQVDVNNIYTGMEYPHAIASNPTFDTFYVCADNGNCIYRLTSPYIPGYNGMISLDGAPPTDNSSIDKYGLTQYPHDIQMSQDYSKYFVTCQQTNEVRVMDTHADTVIKVIPVGTYPQEFAMSKTHPYLFVSCMQDNSPLNPVGSIGCVYVINYNTLQVITVLRGDFFQPHEMVVDDRDNTLYVFSRNADGKPTHHSTSLNQPDGWYTLYDLNTLKPLDGRRYELKADPYTAAPRFTD